MEDPVFIDRYASLCLDVEDLGALYERFCDIVRRGESLPPEISMLKLWATETVKRLSEAMLEAAQGLGGTQGMHDFDGIPIDLLGVYYLARPTTIRVPDIWTATVRLPPAAKARTRPMPLGRLHW